MNASFNNYNSTIGIQVAGNYYAANQNNMIGIENQLECILNEINTNSLISKKEALVLVETVRSLKNELASKSPRLEVMEKSVATLGSVSTISSFALQIYPLLRSMF